MQLDAFTLFSAVSELDKLLKGGKINKITQPSNDTIVFNVYNDRQDYRLVLAADPASPKLFVRGAGAGEYINPLVAPSFCMHLRKHILGAEILSVLMPPFERLVRFELMTHTEFSQSKMTLVFELMGRYSNVYLLSESGVITDCMKKIPSDMSDNSRNALPNLPYFEPPVPPEILDGVRGVSKVTAGEIKIRAELSGKSFSEEFEALRGEACPTVYFEGSAPYLITAARYKTVNKAFREFDSMTEAMGFFYAEAETQKEMAGLSQRLLSALKKEVQKLLRTRKTLDLRLSDCAEKEKNKLFGDIIMANIYKIKPRDECLEAENFYSECAEAVKIPLDKGLTGAENAQKYYKKYAKQKKTESMTQVQLAENSDRQEYIDSILFSLVAAENMDDLADIESELVAQKILSAAVVKGKNIGAGKKNMGKGKQKNAGKGKKGAEKVPKCLVFEECGHKIYVGKNNVQNEYVTFSVADDWDLWLHVKDAAGSHVVVKLPKKVASLDDIDESVLIAAARLAAKYSSVSSGAKISVDYCLKKNVKKARTGVGRVYYTEFKTVIVAVDGVQ